MGDICASFARGIGFKSWHGYRLSWLSFFSWFSFFLPGTCQISPSDYMTFISFNIICNSVFIDGPWHSSGAQTLSSQPRDSGSWPTTPCEIQDGLHGNGTWFSERFFSFPTPLVYHCSTIINNRFLAWATAWSGRILSHPLFINWGFHFWIRTWLVRITIPSFDAGIGIAQNLSYWKLRQHIIIERITNCN